MNFLLATNVVSEWVKPRPNPGVITWLAGADEDRIFLSVITLGELRHGIERMADGARRKRLEVWLRDELPLRFEGRIAAIDAKIADAWGKLLARGEAAGRPLGTVDALIAATASVGGMSLVTRNTADFQAWLPAIVNPWVEI
ncbi:MAG: type II toxin-antitoxin system VapC family toxin [Candidatus Binataceae bacterium]